MKFKIDLCEGDSGWIVRNAMLFVDQGRCLTCDWQAWFETKEDAMAFMVALAKETFPE